MFRDRRQAGEQLAEELERFKDRCDVVILALPRGGIPVAYEVARALRVPLDVFVVRKLGVPRRTELAMGAIASGGVQVLNERVVRELGISNDVIEEAVLKESRELERRERAYRGDCPPPTIAGKIVILIDDGLATGTTMRVAVKAVRRLEAARIVVAVPVGSPDTCSELGSEADEVVCVVQPEKMYAVGGWYRNFEQTTDEEVQNLLADARNANLP